MSKPKNYVAVTTVGHLEGQGVWMPGEKIPASVLGDQADYLLAVKAIVPEDGTAVSPESGEVAALKAELAEKDAEIASLKAELVDANPPEAKAPEDMTNDQLKALLTEKGIEFDARAKKEELLALIPAE